MKYEKKVIYNLTLDSDEKAGILKYMTAVKNANSTELCEIINCGDINCSERPFNDLTDLESQMHDIIIKFLITYRTLQKDNPNLPSID